MAKSAGNFYTLGDLEKKGFDPLAYRYLLLQTNYKQKVNFTWESLEASAKGYQNLKNKIEKLKEVSGSPTSSAPEVGLRETGIYLADFSAKITPLNPASALAVLQAVLSAKDLPPAQKLALIIKFDEVLGLKLI